MTTSKSVPVPTIVSPKHSSTVSNPVSIKGQGLPNAIVKIANAGSGQMLSVTVDSQGNWQWQGNLPTGVQYITACQALGGDTSQWITLVFTVD